MKKTVYFRLEYYKDTDDLSYKYRNRLFINFLRKIKKLKYVFGNIKRIESDDKIEYICYTVRNKEEKMLKKIENIVRKNINANIILSRRIKEIASNKENIEIYQNVNKIIKNRKLTLMDLYKKINGEIRIARLSDIRVARAAATKEEIKILALYLDLSDEEIEDLEDMELDKILLENAEKINDLMALVPKNLKAGQEVIKECPNCGAKLKIARAKMNDHLWIVCDKEGVLICQ